MSEKFFGFYKGQRVRLTERGKRVYGFRPDNSRSCTGTVVRWTRDMPLYPAVYVRLDDVTRMYPDHPNLWEPI